MDDLRTRHCDRRQNEEMPITPFKDSKGVLVWECRRKTPDRRTGDIETEWLSEAIHW